MQNQTVLATCSAFILLVIMAGVTLAFPGTTEATSLNEIRKLTASDAAPGDVFGYSVAVSGDTVVAGARDEDAGGNIAGAAYVFQRDQGGAGSWGEVKKLTASDGGAGERFGHRVAVSGDIAIVGAGEGNSFAEAAYVFQRDQGGTDNWGEVKKLTASDADPGDRFGVSVAVSGEIAVVGASNEGFASGTFGPGAAYVFQRNQGGADNWGEVKKLTASDAQDNDHVGWSVAVSGDIAIVGAFNEDSAAHAAGAAYVFQRDQGGAENWGLVKKLIASDAQSLDAFGWSVALSGHIAVVGARGEGGHTGAAYVFQRDQGGADNWGEVKKLIASNAESPDFFGHGVAVSGDVAIVGAPEEDTGVGNSGAAYEFQRDAGGADNWGEVKKLTATDAEAGDNLGSSVAVSGGIAVSGALFEDAGGDAAGAAYVFDLLVQKPTPTFTITPTPTDTPTPRPTLNPVGGIALDPALRPLPLETVDSDRAHWRIAVAIAAAASLIGASSVVWYTRLRSPS